MGSALAAARLGPLIGSVVKQKTAVTREDHQAAEGPAQDTFAFHFEYPQLLLIFTITMMFSITMPLTPLFGLLYFTVKHTVDKHNLCYVHPRPPQSDGKMIGSASTIAWVVLVGMQISTVGTLLGKRAGAEATIAILILIAGIVLFVQHRRGLREMFLQDLWVPGHQLKGLASASSSHRRGGHAALLSGKGSASLRPDTSQAAAVTLSGESDGFNGETPASDLEAQSAVKAEVYVNPAISA